MDNSQQKNQQNVNILELEASRFGLRTLCKNEFNRHILIQIDNTSAVSAINEMATVKSIEIMKCIVREFISTQTTG